jgi:peptide/nickel transport system ATP-binding protein/oligopeptide transport system ATP-binding protein
MLLEVCNLQIAYPGTGREETRVVAGLSYRIRRGETLAVVGESGCGKTMMALSLMGLLPGQARVAGDVLFEGRDLLAQSAREWRHLRGRDIAMVFQEPMTAMNPVMPVGAQIAESVVVHKGLSKEAGFERAVELLEAMGISSSRRMAMEFPHQLSGGMRQRATIAMALICKPKLLIADEPTTALDVTIQAQILDLISDLQEEAGMAVLFITHNLAVVSELAHQVLVMYGGRGVEHAPAEEIFERPLHPYTCGLIGTMPDPGRKVERLSVIPGTFRGRPEQGCCFAPRCPLATDECHVIDPPLLEAEPGHRVACLKVAR